MTSEDLTKRCDEIATDLWHVPFSKLSPINQQTAREIAIRELLEEGAARLMPRLIKR